jgi:hypothetical protein
MERHVKRDGSIEGIGACGGVDTATGRQMVVVRSLRRE